MIIVNERPPIYAEAKKHFDIDDSMTFYTWGDTIYNPAGVNIHPSIIVHESIHSKQQEKIGGPQKWWDRYFIDSVWRLQQEVEAYHAQYKHYCTLTGDRNVQAKYLVRLAQDLASPLYKANVGHTEAMGRIRKGV